MCVTSSEDRTGEIVASPVHRSTVAAFAGAAGSNEADTTISPDTLRVARARRAGEWALPRIHRYRMSSSFGSWAVRYSLTPERRSSHRGNHRNARIEQRAAHAGG